MFKLFFFCMIFLISLDGMASRDDCLVQPCDAILDPLVAMATVGQIMPWIWRGNYNSGMCWYLSFVCVYEFVYAICGLFSRNVLFIYTVLFTSLSRVEADTQLFYELSWVWSIWRVDDNAHYLNCRDILCIYEYVRTKHTIRDGCEWL